MDGRTHLRQAIAERLAQRDERPFSLHEVRLHARELVLAGTLSQEDADELLAGLRDELERLSILQVRRFSASARGRAPIAVRKRADAE
ncbi:hypothetical protein [Amycolatopsis sp. GM8]|uniref:hypothetical protein n=1 Tax=Amycolatopsis sp. GM8 TaxID=2896530 RepID=UPI001F26EB20|nr:hypothetical protein [Amycolatopsis sp. GM8]